MRYDPGRTPRVVRDESKDEEGSAMRKLGLLFGIGAVALGGGIGMVGACAIDDDVTWITGEDCTGSCRVAPATDYACDVDSSCTPSEGCIDWDCTEDDLGGNPRDVSADGGVDVGDGDDAGVVPTECDALGGGTTFDTAQALTRDVTEDELSCCPTSSRWFRFSVPAGTRFAVDVVPSADSQVTFLLYAEDETVLAGAEMSADASFAADAATSATYYLRVRSGTEAMAYYSLTVRTVVD